MPEESSSFIDKLLLTLEECKRVTANRFLEVYDRVDQRGVQVARLTFIRICATRLLLEMLINIEKNEKGIGDKAVILRSKRYIDGKHIVVTETDENDVHILGIRYDAYDAAEEARKEIGSALKQPTRTPAWRIVKEARVIIEIWMNELNHEDSDDAPDAAQDQEERKTELMGRMNNYLAARVTAALGKRVFKDAQDAFPTVRDQAFRLAYTVEAAEQFARWVEELDIIEPPSMKDAVETMLAYFKSKYFGDTEEKEVKDVSDA